MNTQASIKSRAKSSAPSCSKLRQKALHLAVASCFAVMPAVSLAFTVNHEGVAGVTSAGSGSNNVTISTTATNTILKWPSFNILSAEKVHFAQISAASAVLNRVAAGGGMSQILGTLSSNGKVFLINPAGIMVGAGATINTAGFVASSLNMTDSDFLNGKMRFNADTLSAGRVSNAGEITTPNGGFVYLIAPQVENTGLISTPSGEAILAAGHSVELVDSSDPAMRVKVSAQSNDVNLSQIVTQNGGNIFSVLNSGKVSANTAVVGQNGKIQFRSAGKLDTTATSVVEAKGTSTLDGGYFRGFADTDGIYKGVIDVSGQNGGFIETSGRYIDVNSVQIKANALSPNGKGGTWLIDPFNIVIGTGVEDIQSYYGSTYYGGSLLLASTVNTALDAGINVVVDTGNFGLTDPGQAGNITVNAAIQKTGGAASTLTLNADGAITINSSITDTTGLLNLVMLADRDENGGGGINVNFNLDVGGNISLTAYSGDISLNNVAVGGDVGVGSTISFQAYGGDINLTNSGVGVDSGSVYVNLWTFNGGDINLNASSVGVTNAATSGNIEIKAWNGGNINLLNAGVGAASGAINTMLKVVGSGNISLINSQMGVVNATTGGSHQIWTSSGNISLNNSGVGAGSGSASVSMYAYGGDISLNNSDVGVETGSGGSVTLQAGHYIGGADAGDIIFTRSAGTDHSIRASSVTLRANKGDVGSAASSVITDALHLNVQSSSDVSGNGGNAYVENAGILDSAYISVTNHVELQLDAGLGQNPFTARGSYGGIDINAGSALLLSLTDLVLDGTNWNDRQFIDFDGFQGGGGDFVVEAPNIIMTRSTISADGGEGGGDVSLGVFAHNITMSDSDIAVNSYYGGGNASLGVFATEGLSITGSSPNNSPSYGLHAHSTDGDASVVASAPSIVMDNATIHAESDYGDAAVSVISNSLDMVHWSDIHARAATSYYGGSGDAVVDIFAFDHLNVDYSEIAANSNNGSGTINILAGEVNVTNSFGSGESFIHAQNDLSIIAGGDINLLGGGSSGDSFLAAGDEMFLTLGGTLNLTSSGATGYGGAAQISVGSPDTLFMDFPVLTEDGFFVDGVANSFQSAINDNTGIFVNGAPGVLDENVFVTYAVLTQQDKDDILTGITKELLAGTNFFGDDDTGGNNKNDDDDDDDKNSNNGKGSSKKKQCS